MSSEEMKRRRVLWLFTFSLIPGSLVFVIIDELIAHSIWWFVVLVPIVVLLGVIIKKLSDEIDDE